ncbi:hypothetical protein [Vitiosangium sp. GDMCC 1.1324]|uniref:lipase family protein n=1 Tax=Vitiosangium sp. (strain GDMCC 1.1324) TaxID=2138576 RepID=UPI000D3B80EA|nr:hypothetical protein [Vitiosangium sp. GDMCC 1.1324]PTL76540.1 hypothetical protein DAT35_48880 [Vitiosangium sp. GDMCC 1.1324]
MKSVPSVSPGGSYDIVQTVFNLSILSNAANSVTGQTATQLQALLSQRINAAFQKDVGDIGPWEIVWGPAVFEYNDSGTVDNALYVARNTAIDYYVVGVAATNGTSHYDIYTLDLNVKKTVAFPSGITPTGCPPPSGSSAGNVSLGTALGITNLLQLTDSSQAGSPNLQTFLAGAASSGATLVFTGHSLGGALSPALALWLYPQPTASPWKAVYVLPTAGPSPGDAGFRAGFAEAFQQLSITGVNPSYGFWNTLIWNEFDAVPHAWTNIMKVQPTTTPNDILWGSLLDQSLYGPLSKAAQGGVVPLVEYLYSLPGMTYARLPDTMFSSGYSPAEVPNLSAFEQTVLTQHIQAYGTFFGVPINRDIASGIGISLLKPVPTADRTFPESVHPEGGIAVRNAS